MTLPSPSRETGAEGNVGGSEPIPPDSGRTAPLPDSWLTLLQC